MAPLGGRGFSLPELILVLLVVGVLSAVAAVRWDGGRTVDELGFSETALAALRHAQRRALADGCEVRVRISSSSLEIHQRASLCAGAFDRAVSVAAGTSVAVPPAGVTLSGAPSVFFFDAAGRVLSGPGGVPTDVEIIVGDAKIDVVGATGYAAPRS